MMILCIRNLVDAANVAALASLSTFRRPECSLGGEDGQKVVVHPPEVSFHQFNNTVCFYACFLFIFHDCFV